MSKLIDAVKAHPNRCMSAAVCAVAIAVVGCYAITNSKTVPRGKQRKVVDCKCTTTPPPTTPAQEGKIEPPKRSYPHRPKSYTREQALDMKKKYEEEKWTKVAIANFYGISTGTVTNAIKSVS